MTRDYGTKLAQYHIERIRCPQCEYEQDAVVVQTWPWYSYVHTCEQCKYTILESEWERVEEASDVQH